MDRYGYLKTAAAIPSVRVADCAYNGERIAALVADAAGRGVEVVKRSDASGANQDH